MKQLDFFLDTRKFSFNKSIRDITLILIVPGSKELKHHSDPFIRAPVERGMAPRTCFQRF